MNKKHSELKRKRIMNYFLDAAEKIAQKRGIESLSIRNVADAAGYNSATLYNYFENFDQLTAFLVIRSMAGYLKESMEILSNITDPFHNYLSLWEIYCKCSFEKPSIFTYAYSSSKQKMNNVQIQTKSYFEIFYDEEIDAADNAYFVEEYQDVNNSIRKRFVKAGLFSEEDSKEVIEFGHFLYLGVLQDALTRNERTPDEYTAVFMKYFVPFLKQKVLTNN